jgi:hypothetical protein
MPRVIDTFPFFNEFEMMDLRAATLRGVVDLHFGLAMARTHAGKLNPHIDTYRSMMRVPNTYLAMIQDEPIILGDSDSIAATRRREMFQRNQIAPMLYDFITQHGGKLQADDIILLSDADEIPHPTTVYVLRNQGLKEGEIVVFQQRMCYYDLNTTQGYIWQGTRAVRWDDFCALSPHVVRYGLGAHDQHYPKYFGSNPGGWHLSYFGGPQKVQEKMTNFLHQELVTAENTQQDTIAERIAAGADIWGRDGHDWSIEKTTDVPIPVMLDPQRWRHLWRPGYEPTDEQFREYAERLSDGESHEHHAADDQRVAGEAGGGDDHQHE